MENSCKFRNSNWYIGETYELLDEYAAVAVMRFKKGKLPDLVGNAGFIYALSWTQR
jgi:hypothetical protein